MCGCSRNCRARSSSVSEFSTWTAFGRVVATQAFTWSWFCVERSISRLRRACSAVAMAGANHSQQGLGNLLKPYLEEALLHHFSPPQGAGPIQYADFGCGSGGNTLNYAKFAVEVLKTKPEIHGREIVCHFADLPSNDFNALFNLFPPIVGQGVGDGGAEERTWFASGVPGSQFDRMFPRSSLNVAISTQSLHFLSEVRFQYRA